MRLENGIIRQADYITNNAGPQRPGLFVFGNEMTQLTVDPVAAYVGILLPEETLRLVATQASSLTATGITTLE